MKKFNPEKEFENLKKKKNKTLSRSTLSNMYVPLLIIGCSCMALLGATFSLKLTDDTKNEYLIKVDIINGNEDSLQRYVKEGAFSATVTSNNSFGSIECSSGELKYDAMTSTIYSPYINKNTSCVLSFMDDQVKELKFQDLGQVNDELGLSYYYKADAKDNYVSLNNMIFRIIRINGDGTYRLMLDDNVLASVYGNSASYSGSNLESTLNSWFNNNFANANYVVRNPFDAYAVTEVTGDNLINFTGYIDSYVGTLSANEMALITKDVENISYNISGGMYLMNTDGDEMAYAYRDGEIVLVPLNTNLVVRPVINVKGNLVGDGTINSPYILEEE